MPTLREIVLFAPLCFASAASCQQATSKASISIRVSVAPRIWIEQGEQLCTTLPKGTYRLRYAGVWISQTSQWRCKMKGSAHRIKAAYGGLVLIVPE